MNLCTPNRKPLLRNRYVGSRILPGQIIGKPIAITRFEIVPSRKNPGKPLLVAQIESDGIPSVLMTESWTLIDTIRGTESELPHHTKIVRKRDGYYYFVQLNKMEIKQLIGGSKND